MRVVYKMNYLNLYRIEIILNQFECLRYCFGNLGKEIFRVNITVCKKYDNLKRLQYFRGNIHNNIFCMDF